MIKFYFSFIISVLIAGTCAAQSVQVFVAGEQEFTIQEVRNQDFEPIESGYTNGLTDGFYWLKIEPSQRLKTFELRNNRIIDVTVYHDGKLVDVEMVNEFASFEIATEGFTYARLYIDKEAYIPFRIFNQNEYYHNAIGGAIVIGIFYGFSLMVILLNLSLFYHFKELSFLLYSIFLFFIIAVFAYRDGFIEILGLTQNLKEITEPVVHAVGGLAGAAFASEFLNIKRHFTRLYKSYFYLIVPFSVVIILYFITGNYIYFLFVDLLCLYIFASSWFCALLLFNKDKNAIIFRVSYLLMLCTATLFYLFPALQIDWIEIDQKHLKWSGYIEMIVVTSAVIYRMKLIRERHQIMRDEVKQYLSEINYLSQELERAQVGEQSVFALYDLTARESEILEMIAKGDSNKVIADELFISVNTVKYHVKKIYEKLDVSNRKEAFHKLTTSNT